MTEDELKEFHKPSIETHSGQNRTLYENAVCLSGSVKVGATLFKLPVRTNRTRRFQPARLPVELLLRGESKHV